MSQLPTPARGERPDPPGVTPPTGSRPDPVRSAPTSAPVRIGPDDPRAPDVQALLARHLEFAARHSPPEDLHALDVTGLLGAQVSFVSARREGRLVGVAALRRLEPGHGEIKSMHTAADQRGTGGGRALLEHLLALARAASMNRVSLETGSMAAFRRPGSSTARPASSTARPSGTTRPARTANA